MYLTPQPKLSTDLNLLQNEPEIAEKISRLTQKYPTFEKFALTNSPSKQITICHNPEECVYGDSPLLRFLDITYGMHTSAIWLVPQIADASVCCGLKEDASEDQLRLVATALASRYHYLKTDELMLFFFNFKAGFYEGFYSYFDPQVIIRSMKTFLNDRMQIILSHECKMKEINDQKYKLPGISLEEINKNYFTTETLNRILHRSTKS